jgi:hypothetical protein
VTSPIATWWAVVRTEFKPFTGRFTPEVTQQSSPFSTVSFEMKKCHRYWDLYVNLNTLQYDSFFTLYLAWFHCVCRKYELGLYLLNQMHLFVLANVASDKAVNRQLHPRHRDRMRFDLCLQCSRRGAVSFVWRASWVAFDGSVTFPERCFVVLLLPGPKTVMLPTE